MVPMWTDVAQAMGAIGALLVAIIGFFILIIQIRQLERAIRSDTHSSLYSQCFDTTKLFYLNAKFLPYVYENKDLSKDDPSFYELSVLVEIIADFFEHIALQKTNLPDEVWNHWNNYIRSIYKSCPLLREHFRKRAEWYSEAILGLFKNI